MLISSCYYFAPAHPGADGPHSPGMSVWGSAAASAPSSHPQACSRTCSEAASLPSLPPKSHRDLITPRIPSTVCRKPSAISQHLHWSNTLGFPSLVLSLPGSWGQPALSVAFQLLLSVSLLLHLKTAFYK